MARLPFRQIQSHIENINALKTESGLFVASAKDVKTGYDKAWLRDNFYTALAYEYIDDWDTVKKTWRAVLDIFIKHREKINWAVEHKPLTSWQYIHARYHPETFEEFWEEWGNKQNDAVGAILFKLADLELTGHGVISSDEDKAMIHTLVNYLKSIEYWHDPDNGMWEEYEEVHASSIGSCVAGLKRVNELGFINVPEWLIANGEEALRKLLPRESKSKFTDLALLSLIWPYNIINDKKLEDQILANVEYHLARSQGVIRYKNDRYYNANEDGWSEEAEWTMGFPWLALIYNLRGDKNKYKEYITKAREAIHEESGKLPELYYSQTKNPNENVPLGWAESLMVVALSARPTTHKA